MVAVHDREREVPVQLVVRQPGRLDKVAVVVLLDQVADHLAVGIGVELVALLDQPRPQLHVVLDDAVVHGGHAGALAGLNRVRVRLRHPAVGRPARVRQPQRGRMGAVADRIPQHLYTPDPPRDVHAAVDQRDPGRVVAAVLEPLQTGQQQLLALPVTDISDDSAHSDCLRPDLGLHKSRQVLADAFALRFVGRLDHDTNQWFGPRRAQHDPAVLAKLLAQRLHLLPDAVSGR